MTLKFNLRSKMLCYSCNYCDILLKSVKFILRVSKSQNFPRASPYIPRIYCKTHKINSAHYIAISVTCMGHLFAIFPGLHEFCWQACMSMII